MIEFVHPDIPEDVQARRRELARLGDEIARLSAHIQAATWRLLEMIRAFDASDAWYEEGFRTCAGWLSWRTGITPGAAREKVRVARALGELPVLSEALRRGELSYSVARAITRVATPETEADWVEMARHSTAAQLERLVSGWRTVRRIEDREREQRRHAERALWVMPDADGSWRIRGRLDPEVGAVLCRALEAAGEALYRREPAAEEPVGDEPVADEPVADEPVAARRADALGLVAEAALGTGLGEDSEDAPVVGRAERFQVVVHVSAETLEGTEREPEAESVSGTEREADVSAEMRVGAATERGEGADGGIPAAADPAAEHRVEGRPPDSTRAPRIANGSGDALPAPRIPGRPGGSLSAPPRIRGGPAVSAETARRLACDSDVVEMRHHSDGGVLDVGRRRRTVPTALRRALLDRDRGCRFPGCAARFCDAHHVRHWAQGGTTRLDNLLLLCRHHHRRVHEEGWSVTLEGDGEARFHRPDGRLLPDVPETPAVPLDPVAELERLQAELGIDAWTATPRWTGERLDLHWAMAVLCQRWAPEDVSAETSARGEAPETVSAETSAGRPRGP